jgi:hypothetical protein
MAGAEQNRAGLFTNCAMKMGGYKVIRFACLVALLLGPAGMSSAAPAEFEMNGIVMVPGDKRVIIKTHDATGLEINVMLAEGQSRDGIKLLSVDTKNNVAKFDNHGSLQVLKICPTPELTINSVTSQNQRMASPSSQPSVATGKTPVQVSAAANPFAAAGGESNSGYIAVAVAGGNSSTDSGSAPPAATTGANPANGSTTGVSSTSDSSSSEQDSWWYGGSQEIEQARLQTAEAVRNGALPPYPLTPLTPRGTPPELIGPGQVFFNHFSRVYHAN